MNKSQNAVQLFKHEQFGEIRTAGTWDNPLFCLADVCKALEIGNPSDVKNRLEKGVVTIETLQTAGGMQKLTFINEDGLYDVVLDSRKPEAKKFRKWITSEVLPSIRKTGEYKIDDAEPKAPLRISDVAQDVVSAAKIFEEYFGLKQGIAFVYSVALAESNYNINLDPIKKLAPPAEHNTGYMNTTQLGEKIGRTARQTNKWLADNGYQFRDGRDWRLTEKGKQYAEEMPYVNNGHSGYQIRWSEPAVELLLEEFVH